MANIVTITNNYDNGVCDGFRIYTGTTFNGDPYVIPNTTTLISSELISLPYDLNVGDYEGPLYIFLEHCDFPYVTPPPQSNPKKQGGFQVEFINIECLSCEDFTAPQLTPGPSATPGPTPTPTPTPIQINTETEINIFFDSSGSMNSTLSPLNTMRTTILQNCLLPFYNNDVNLYNERVTITSISDERAIQWIATPPSDPSYNVINLAFADESNQRYEAESQFVTGWTDGSVSGDADIAQLRNTLENATTSSSHRGIIFQVDTLSGTQQSYPEYQNFINAVFNGLGYYAGTAGLSDKSEVSAVQDVVAASTPQYYADLIVTAMNNLGYSVPNC